MTSEVMPYRQPAPRDDQEGRFLDELAATFAKSVRRRSFRAAGLVTVAAAIVVVGIASFRRARHAEVEVAYAELATCLDESPSDNDEALAQRMRGRELALAETGVHRESGEWPWGCADAADRMDHVAIEVGLPGIAARAETLHERLVAKDGETLARLFLSLRAAMRQEGLRVFFAAPAEAGAMPTPLMPLFEPSALPPIAPATKDTVANVAEVSSARPFRAALDNSVCTFDAGRVKCAAGAPSSALSDAWKGCDNGLSAQWESNHDGLHVFSADDQGQTFYSMSGRAICTPAFVWVFSPEYFSRPSYDGPTFWVRDIQACTPKGCAKTRLSVDAIRPQATPAPGGLRFPGQSLADADIGVAGEQVVYAWLTHRDGVRFRIGRANELARAPTRILVDDRPALGSDYHVRSLAVLSGTDEAFIVIGDDASFHAVRVDPAGKLFAVSPSP